MSVGLTFDQWLAITLGISPTEAQALLALRETLAMQDDRFWLGLHAWATGKGSARTQAAARAETDRVAWKALGAHEELAHLSTALKGYLKEFDRLAERYVAGPNAPKAKLEIAEW